MTGLSIISARQSDDLVFTIASANNLDRNIGSNSLNGNVDLSDIEGSPYENDAFLVGKAVSKKMNNSTTCLLRYNIYNDIIEIKEHNATLGLIKSLHIYAVINDIEYHYEDFIDKPAKFVDSQAYYFKKHNVLIPFPDKKKELFQLFPENEHELNRYLKEEKINLKSEEDIKKLFSYLDAVLK